MEARTAGRRAALALPAKLRSPLTIVAGITLAGGLLRFWALGSVQGNPYYDAAVRSMGLSLHNFFFAAYEPGGSVAIDKPPVDLWLQVASTKLLGFNSRALVAPQAIASTAAIPLLYAVVRRGFGTTAGIASAAALAFLPISVVTGRSDTMDSLAMALSVAAVWLTIRAAETERTRYVLAVGAVCGLAFEVKLFEGLIVVPALALLYWLAAPTSRGRRVQQLATAGAVLAVVALAWPLAVSLAPKSDRPYPIGSTNGTVWSSIFYFNGIQRLQGPRHAHPGGRPHVAARFAVPKNPATGPSPGRLFAHGGWDLGWLVGIELLAALLLGAVALATRPWSRAGPTEPPRLRLALGAAFGLWLVVGTVLFSKQEVLHGRYIEGMTPAIAASLGIGLAALGMLARAATPWRVIAVAALAGASAYELSITPSFAAPVVAAGIAAALLILLPAKAWERGRVLRGPAVAALAAVALLVVPARTSIQLVKSHATDGGQLGGMPQSHVDALSRYLAPRTRGARYEAAVANYSTAATLIIRDARPIMILEGVERRPIATVEAVRKAARRGDLRYALIGGNCGLKVSFSHCSRALRWIRAHSVDVTRAAGVGDSGFVFELRPHGITRSNDGRRGR
jgi:4-amino-4-deoxy-L-arabinose transferase-like glycosyltransferase